MTEQISIWRWTGEEDLSGVLHRFFSQGESTPVDETEDMAKAVEAKYRAMGLPEDILATMLEGLGDLVEEAALAEGMKDGTTPEEPPLDPVGGVAMSLASSQMFLDDPYAALGEDQVQAQVQAQMAVYLDAVSAFVGSNGQSLAAFLGCSEARLAEAEVTDKLLWAGMEDIVHIWAHGDEVVYLRLSTPPRPTCIDIELGRAPKVAFDVVKSGL